jgi:hypothetical protein
MRTDGWADIVKLTVAFRNENAPNNNNNNNKWSMFICVLSQQPDGQLQKQHNIKKQIIKDNK